MLRKTVAIFALVLLFGSSVFAEQADKQKLTQDFFKMDANKDGVISLDEIEAYSDRAFSEMDRDTNQYLDTDEVDVKSQPGMVLQKADQDKNGQITKQEAKAEFRQYFEEMDINKDNKVSLDEYNDYWKGN